MEDISPKHPQRLRCLVMICCDEEEVIERCMRSAAPFVDTYCICYNGSPTGKTKKIIFDTMTSLGVFGVIHDHPWEGFGKSRTKALEAAREHCPDGWSWMIDADDQLMGAPLPVKWWDSISEKVSAMLLQTRYTSGSRMNRLQIFSNRHNWDYSKYRWHEVPHLHEVEGQGKDQLFIPDFVWQLSSHEGVQAKNPHKHHKAVLELRKDREDMPDDQRPVYYLAQELRNIDCKHEAKQMSKLCVTMKGDIHERYLSYVELMHMADDINKKFRYAWAAVDLDPTRLEAPYYIFVHFTHKTIDANNKIPQQAAAIGMSVKNKKREVLSSHCMVLWEEIYTWRFSKEFSIVLCWTGRYRKSLKEGQLALRRCPVEWKKTIEDNNKFPAMELEKEYLATHPKKK